MKKVFGVIFIVLGALFALSVVIQLPDTLGQIVMLLKADSANGIGYGIGRLFATAIFAGIAYMLLHFGIKWMKSKPTV